MNHNESNKPKKTTTKRSNVQDCNFGVIFTRENEIKFYCLLLSSFHYCTMYEYPLYFTLNFKMGTLNVF